MSEFISSLANPVAKQVRSLRQKKNRDESGLFIVEGIAHTGEAMQAGWKIEMLVAAPDLLQSKFAHGLLEQASQRSIRVIHVTPALFESLASKENPQGILAIVHQKIFRLEDLSPKEFEWGVACASPQDPGNIGAILRTLDAVNASGLILLEGGADPFHPSAVRASMGALFWKPVIRASFDEFLSWCRRHRYLLLGSSSHADQDYRNFQRNGQPVILLLGNEQKGLSPAQQAACDLVLGVPMLGRVSSLNLAVAAGVLLYQMEFPAGKIPPLSAARENS